MRTRSRLGYRWRWRSWYRGRWGPDQLPWAELGVDVVLESTGPFSLSGH
ncbi:MAG: hypothetical protein IJ985_03510 [Akkermansia sp.]|nr:hypothetical protein [Akkermansia sp.]